MTLAVYSKACSKNVSGNTRIFIAEAVNVSAIVVTAGEISSITGSGAFKEIQTDLDRIIRTEEKIAGKLNHAFDVSIDMVMAKPTVDLNILRTSLVDASPCGMLALVRDGNGTWWLVGYNELDLLTRSLYLLQDNFTSGAELIDLDGNKASLKLMRSMADPSLPLDSTLAGQIDGGTAEFVSYTGCDGYSNHLTNTGFIVNGELCNGDWVDTNTDGTADSWLQDSGAGTPAIVTGNGFTGNAQRANHVTGTITRFQQSTGVTAENGETYRITGKFRAGLANWRIYLRTTSDVMTNNMTANTGNATSFQFDVVATAAAEIVLDFYRHDGEANDYLEIDELRLWKIS